MFHDLCHSTLGQPNCLRMVKYNDLMLKFHHLSELFYHTIIELRATVDSDYRPKNTDPLEQGFDTLLGRSTFRWVQTNKFTKVIHDKDNLGKIFVAQPRVSKDKE
jgi:hypothetical protein